MSFLEGGRAAMLLTYDEGNFPATARSSHMLKLAHTIDSREHYLCPYLRLHLDEQHAQNGPYLVVIP